MWTAVCRCITVQHMLGHVNVSQTSTYLNATTIGLHDGMRRFDGRIRTSFAQEDEAPVPIHLVDRVSDPPMYLRQLLLRPRASPVEWPHLNRSR
jgi:hypothetical protein